MSDPASPNGRPPPTIGYATASRPPIRVGWLVSAALPPTLLITVAMVIAEQPSVRPVWPQSLGPLCPLASTAAGAGCLWRSGLRPRVWVPLPAVYVPVQLGWLVRFALEFSCSCFGDCL